jgi:transglutaminase-like putative cysteine protease
VHFAGKALSTSGVEEISTFSVSFDPSYQSVTLHAIKVTRDGAASDRLKSAKVRVLQRETGIEERTYDGRKTVNVSLEDIRVGDVVEYSYSVAGSNPVFNNLAAGRLELQWSVPVDRMFARLLLPSDRKISVFPSKSAQQPVTREVGAYTEYRFDQRNVAALQVDPDTPEDFDPYASVEWNEYGSWGAVAAWAVPLYKIPQDPGAAVKREIDRIRAAHADQAGRVAAVLHFVQREIRYLGVQVGAGTHRPNSPSAILQRRFGDCKDKAVLTVTMLRAMGIDATPALVNTEIAGAVKEQRPSPNAFNHVLVKVKLDGRAYWIDPTRTLQPSTLDKLHQPDYGYTLVIDPATADLEAMTAERRYAERVHAVYDSRAGVGKPVSYTVTTRMLGFVAENMRNRIAARGIGEIEDQYLNFYAKRFAAIKTAAPMEFTDDEKNNELVMVEKYTLPDFWVYSKEKRRQTGHIESAGLVSNLYQPDKLIRTSPLAVAHPRDLEEVTEVLLPEAWEVTPQPVEVNDPAFTYRHGAQTLEGGMKLVFTDTYRTLADRVSPERVAAYAKNLDTAYEAVGYHLYKQDKRTPSWVGSGGGWPTWLTVIGLLGLLWWIVKRVLPHPASVVPRTEQDSETSSPNGKQVGSDEETAETAGSIRKPK